MEQDSDFRIKNLQWVGEKINLLKEEKNKFYPKIWWKLKKTTTNAQ